MSQWLMRVGCAGAVALASSCDRGQSEPSEPASRPVQAMPAAQDLAAIERMVADSGSEPKLALPSGHPPIPAMLAVEPNAQAARPLTYQVPARWKQVQPASAMRLAQYEIPPAAGDTIPGEVAVFHFAGAGGSVEDNIKRWIGQFVTADGRPIEPSAVRRDAFEVGLYRVHFVELSGYMVVSPTLGGTGCATTTEYRLLGAIVETREGNWFFKGTGPSATMEAAREEMLSMLRSIRP